MQQDVPPPPNQRAPEFGLCRVTAATGCPWFAGSDDRQAEWCYTGTGSEERRRHIMRCGQPWASDETGNSSEAGERRVEIRLQLISRDVPDVADTVEEGSQMPCCSPQAWNEALVLAETELRKEFEACLLTRAEANALEAGDPQALSSVKVAQWEGIRAGLADGTPTLSWSPVLGTLEVVLKVISAIPGSASLAAVGGAMTRRAEKALGAHGGLGHEPVFE